MALGINLFVWWSIMIRAISAQQNFAGLPPGASPFWTTQAAKISGLMPAP